MTIVCRKQKTMMSRVIIWALVAGLTMGGTLWAQPMQNAQHPGGQKSGGQQPDDPKKDSRKPGGQEKGTPKGGLSYPTIGRIDPAISGKYDVVRSGSNEYVFYLGVFYTRTPHGFKVMPPPKGCVVSRLPVGFETLVVAGITYFLYAGVYYNSAAAGYVVVDAPAQTVVVQETVADGIGTALVVDVDLLNVRSGPGMNHTVVSNVRSGDTLTVQGTSGQWYYVQLPDGSYGWVMAKFTRSMPPEAKG